MARGKAERIKLEEALVDLYDTHYEKVARYIFVRIGSREDAEDLASETFARALKSLDGYDERGLPMAAWVFKIAHNIVVDHLRKASKRQVTHIEVSGASDGIDPEEAAEVSDQIEKLTRALDRLSAAHREVIALRFYSGLSSEECATILGKKPGAVREMQSAAIKSLRQGLSEEMEP